MRSRLVCGSIAGMMLVCLPALAGGGGDVGGGGGDDALDNAGFEATVLAEGAWSYELPGWTVEGVAGSWNPNFIAFAAGAPESENIAWAIGYRASASSMAQSLGVWKENTRYLLSVQVGNRGDLTFAGYVIELLIDDVVVAEDRNSMLIPTGAFIDVELEYDARQCDDLDGGEFAIRLSAANDSGQVAFDDVRLVEAELPACDADLDCDGMVGLEDVIAMAMAWGPCDDCLADLDGNGVVDVNDIFALLTSWGTCP